MTVATQPSCPTEDSSPYPCHPERKRRTSSSFDPYRVYDGEIPPAVGMTGVSRLVPHSRCSAGLPLVIPNDVTCRVQRSRLDHFFADIGQHLEFGLVDIDVNLVALDLADDVGR